MASLLDNAAPGGLLSDPRIAVLQQILDPAVTKRAALLPMVRTLRPTGNTMVPEEITSREFGTPQIAVDMLGSALLPGAAAQGYTPTMQDAAQFSLDSMLGGGLLGRAPSGSLAVNVFHGTPHKFAPEPGFPYGRPRLDKMGTGEGAQAYGPGFYSAESKGVATDYRNVLSPPPSVRVGGDAMTSSQFANTLSGKAASKYPDMPVEEIERQSGNAARMIFNRAEELKNIDGNDNVLMRAFLDSQSKRDDSLSKILRVARDEMPVAKWSEETGTLYKLDIPDADAAKTLDWDAPLEKQPKPIRDAYSKAMLGDEVFKDPILKELFADGVPNQHLGLLENSSGAQAFNTLAGKLGSQQAAADALREAGIPGVKYLDQGSRGAGEGSRNYSIWDQDVLDRTKMLERDGVTLGANKSPTAATAGLLSRLPMDEQSRMARAEGLGFDFDGFHGTGGKDISEMSGMTWMSESPRLANEYAAMRAISSDGMASQIMPLKARTGNVFNADFLPKSVTVNQMMNEVLDQAENNLGRTFSDGEMNKARKLLGTIRKAAVREESGPNYSRHDFWNDSESIFGKDGAKAIKEIFRMSGFDSISMREGGENTIGILNPSNIRSRFAAFDPAKANSENILAANAAPLGLLSASEY